MYWENILWMDDCDYIICIVYIWIDYEGGFFFSGGSGPAPIDTIRTITYKRNNTHWLMANALLRLYFVYSILL